jgi:DNA segregation ATPase FtsK/SpoIIIE-like protein
MHVTLNTIGKLGKSLNIKREKLEDDTEAVIANLKISNIIITREEMDELLRMPSGWSQQSLYNEQGVPYINVTMTAHRFECTVTGRIKGTAETDEGITLKQANWSGATFDLRTNSALLSGEISWKIAGDEASDIEPLIGRDCLLAFVIQDAQQKDMFDSGKIPAQRLVDSIPGGASLSVNVGGESVVIASSEDTDESVYGDACVLIQREGKLSITSLQRFLRIGYNRAARVLERMATEGVCIPSATTGVFHIKDSVA